MPSQQWRLFGVVVSLPEGSVRVFLHVEAVCYLPFVPQQELGLFLQASIIAWGLRGMWRAIGSVRFGEQSSFLEHRPILSFRPA